MGNRAAQPIEYVKYVMDEMNLKQRDLVKAKVGQKSHISEMLNGKRRFSMSFIRKFLELTHREQMAFILIRDYKLNK
jgi:antitoxin component HigA of HigAB toxin-antitoxin module